jgi:hypothetical protein
VTLNQNFLAWNQYISSPENLKSVLNIKYSRSRSGMRYDERNTAVVDIGGAFLNAEMSGSVPIHTRLDRTLTDPAMGLDKTVTGQCLLQIQIAWSVNVLSSLV